MRGHKICFYGEIWLIIPKLSVNPSYLENCYSTNFCFLLRQTTYLATANLSLIPCFFPRLTSPKNSFSRKQNHATGVCVCSNSHNHVPRVAQRYGAVAAHTQRRVSVLVLVVFCMHMPTFSDTAITERHSDTTIFQLRAHWLRISWSTGSEKSFRHVPPVRVEPSKNHAKGLGWKLFIMYSSLQEQETRSWTVFQKNMLDSLHRKQKLSDYRKNSKIWDTSNNCHNCPKNRKV